MRCLQHRHTADNISKRMIAEGHKVASLHGAKDASERDSIIDNFREGREKVLITTNVIARGIDILQVNMVVNYDLPLMNDRGRGFDNDARPDVETYIHRIGGFLSASGWAACVLIVAWCRSNRTLWAQGHLDQLCA
jgi:ATP-dependent RNA helicase DDX19/DBP5